MWLSDVRVIEIGGYWAAPYGAALLADLGAEVIKIESRTNPDLRMPVEVDGETRLEALPFTKMVNRNKRGLAIDLRDERGRAVLLDLLAISDVLIENLSASARERLDLDAATLTAVNPALVHVSLTGFGSSSPLTDYSAYGPTLEALSGINELVGYPDDGPANIGVGITDPLGGVWGAITALAALGTARRSGRGAHVDVSQFDAALGLLPEAIAEHGLTGSTPPREGNRDDRRDQGVHATADGRYVAVVGVAEGVDIAAVAAQRDLDGAVAELQARGLIAVPVRTMTDVRDDPHLVARGTFADVDGQSIYATAVQAGTGVGALQRLPIRRPAPAWSEATQHVLAGLLGRSEEEITALTEAGVVG